MEFVDLDRYFVPLHKDQEPSLDIGHLWGPSAAGWLNWDELRRRRRVILLAEAASGKTKEFEHQCESLRASGKPAFFLRIEELADNAIESTLDGASIELFRSWLSGSGEAWFFLDAVDEAHLNRKSFDSALKHFARDLGTGLERAYVYVSCRVTDWRGAEDRTIFSRFLPAWTQPAVVPVEKPDDYSALLDPIFKDKRSLRNDQAAKDEKVLNELLVVQLVPLSLEQYRKLATERGVPNVDVFVAAIARHGLEASTERPRDLLDLADYWKTHKRFDTSAKMLEHGITSKLAEQNPHRADNEAISPEEAREGAERLAAALTLGKSFTLRAPGDESDPTLASGALNPKEILPEWTDAKRNALLRRAIFAPATYGRIRFHHRSTQEYLAASWLDRLIRNNCPRSEIFNLLFTERYGVETIVPSLRAEAAWLSLRQPDIRDEVLRREPLTLVTQGDPGSLPLPIREQLLMQYASKQAAGDISDDRLDARELWMFADERLAPTVMRAWQANTHEQFRYDLLRLIREGGIKGASSLARAVALDKKADDNHRIVAAQAAEACGDRPTLMGLAKELVKDAAKASPGLAASLSLILYPDFLSTADLLKIIAKSKKPAVHSAEDFGYVLEKLYDKAPNAAARVAFLGGLSDLCLSKPFVDEFHRIATNFREIAKHLHNVARREVLGLAKVSPPPSHIVRLLVATERGGRDSYSSEAKPSLHELVRNNPPLNRALFWADIAEHRANAKDTIVDYWHVHFGSGSEALWGFAEADLSWLYDDLKSRPIIQDKQVALSAILDILRRAGRLTAEAGTVRSAIGAEALLLDALQSALEPPPESATIRAHRLEREAHDRDAEAQTKADQESWIKFRSDLLADPSVLSNPKHLKSWKEGVFRLHYLTNWLRRRTGSDTPRAVLEWRLLEEGFDRAVAEAYRDGMRQLWRHIPPVRPRRNRDGTITKKSPWVLAFAGIGLEAAEDPDWTLRLNEKEVAIAARHGCRAEEGYPDWIDGLTMSWPNVVRPVLKDQIHREWTLPSDGITSFLNRYGASAYLIQPSVQTLLRTEILRTEAKAISVFHTAIRIIRNLTLDTTQRTELFKAAAARFDAHAKARRDDFALSYLLVLVMLNPDAALPPLQKWLAAPSSKAERTARAEMTLSTLFDRHDPLTSDALAATSTKGLEALLHLAYSHIKPKDDLVHHGTYSPGSRDNAESARNVILSALLEKPGGDAYQAMKRLANDPVFALRAHRFLELARGKAERDAEIPAWTAPEVLTFERESTAPAKTGADLLRIVLGVLADIQHNLTAGDYSSRALLERAQDEYEVQPWLADQMLLRAKGRFHIIREGEIALNDRPDIFVASTASTYQVAVEIKHGGKGWSGPDLENALRVQLAEDYLKPDLRRHGVLVVTHHRNRRWQRATGTKRIEFTELIRWLTSIAATIIENAAGHIAVKCVGLDAWKAEPTPGKASTPKPETSVKRSSATKKATKKAPARTRKAPPTRKKARPQRKTPHRR
ncbi:MULTISPECIES: hypothetical protein [unclassified Bradyrhizobium]|uniref:hypothetical protein n=1 Tax=unclassified Bradyrhizobium TaxID=2631580 RepID=UPI0029166A16|nr:MULTISPECIES: hypothetical protein [unclassified Bradyrhizobium]